MKRTRNQTTDATLRMTDHVMCYKPISPLNVSISNLQVLLDEVDFRCVNEWADPPSWVVTLENVSAGVQPIRIETTFEVVSILIGSARQAL
jgi:hypothetical protein